MPLASSRRGARAAQALVAEYCIEEPREIVVDAICQDQGASVIEGQLTGAVARLVHRGLGRAVIRISDRIREIGRRRFAVAHELGHFVLEHRQNQLDMCVMDNLLWWYREQSTEEREADEFAVELLMPQSFFFSESRRQRPTFAAVGDLAERYQVSMTAAVLRYVESGARVCALVASDGNTVKWTRRGGDFPYPLIPPGAEVEAQSRAAQVLRGTTLPGPGMVTAACWLEAPFTRAHEVMEDVLHLRDYGTLLSLLSITPRSSLDRAVSGLEPL